MASYRFCRSDDVALLVEAHEACCGPPATGVPPLTVESFKRLAREIGLWTSSCMLARDERGPVAVLLAAKREHATLVWRLGCRPDARRQGHGRHLLTSLGSKLAILGPPRLVAEIDAGARRARAFLEACGFTIDAGWDDWRLAPGTRPAVGAPAGARAALVDRAGVAELAASGVLDSAAEAPWERHAGTLLARAQRLEGLAVASLERIEAWLLAERDEAGRLSRVVALGAAAPERAAAWFGLLLGELVASPEHDGITLERVEPALAAVLPFEAWGFRRLRSTLRLAAAAHPA